VIGATAGVSGYVILTRNLRHFSPLGTPALDPFEDLPKDVPR
jgi:predicted nucleic acid-binding protein